MQDKAKSGAATRITLVNSPASNPTQTEDVSEVEALEFQLSQLAAMWRGYHKVGQFTEADTMVREYHAAYKRLEELTGQVDIAADAELPEALMPLANK